MEESVTLYFNVFSVCLINTYNYFFKDKKCLLFFKTLLMWTFFLSLIEFVTHCFCFTVWFFGHESWETLSPQAGIKLAPPALEGEVLTDGLPGKSPKSA